MQGKLLLLDVVPSCMVMVGSLQVGDGCGCEGAGARAELDAGKNCCCSRECHSVW